MQDYDKSETTFIEPILKSLMIQKQLPQNCDTRVPIVLIVKFRSRRIEKDVQCNGAPRATLGVANARAPGMSDRPAPDRAALSFRDGTRRAQDGAAGRAVTADPLRRER